MIIELKAVQYTNIAKTTTHTYAEESLTAAHLDSSLKTLTKAII